MNAVCIRKVQPILIPSSHLPFTERITASLSGEAEKGVSIVTMPLARTSACVHACQHGFKVFHR